MKENIVTEKWNRFLGWIRTQWNKPTSDSATWRQNRTESPAKPAKAAEKSSRRSTRTS